MVLLAIFCNVTVFLAFKTPCGIDIIDHTVCLPLVVYARAVFHDYFANCWVYLDNLIVCFLIAAP